MKINLLPKEERPLRKFEVRWEFLLTLVGILALSIVLTFSHLQIGEVRRLNQRRTELIEKETSLQEQAIKVNSLRGFLSELEDRENSYCELLQTESVDLKSLLALAEHSFTHLWIESLSWQENQVELRGYTGEMTSLARYLNYLNEISIQASLKKLDPYQGTDFTTFCVEIQGVKHRDPDQLY